MSQIKRLTDAQYAQLPNYESKWFKICTSTDQVDHLLIEKSIDKLYSLIKLNSPKKIWLPSPFAGAKKAKEMKNSIFDKIYNIYFDATNSISIHSTPGKVYNEIAGEVSGPLCDKIYMQLIPLLRRNGCDAVGTYHGQHETPLSFFDYARKVLHMNSEKLQPFFDLSQTGWFWAFKDVVVMTERPTILKLDTVNRLHNETDMAIKYSDNFGIFMWHGIQVPSDIILHPESISISQIDKEKNIEIRRIMLERFGIKRFMQESGAKKIGEDCFGVLLKRKIPGDEPIVVVQVDNSTPEPDGTIKKYMLRVPPNIKSPQEGIAWTFGLQKHEYEPIKET